MFNSIFKFITEHGDEIGNVLGKTSCFICCDSNGNPTGFGGNNDKGDTIKMTSKISETNDRLG